MLSRVLAEKYARSRGWSVTPGTKSAKWLGCICPPQTKGHQDVWQICDACRIHGVSRPITVCRINGVLFPIMEKKEASER